MQRDNLDWGPTPATSSPVLYWVLSILVVLGLVAAIITA